MNLNLFIKKTNLRPGDGVRVKKRFLGLLHHYVIYLGNYQSRGHLFIANMTSGVSVLSEGQLQEYLKYLEPHEVKYFKGTEQERKSAVMRAVQYPEPKSYQLLANNCEHFFNYVQKGVSYSKQSEAVGAGLATAGLVMAIDGANKGSEDKTFGGLLLAGLGLFTLAVSGNDE